MIWELVARRRVNKNVVSAFGVLSYFQPFEICKHYVHSNAAEKPNHLIQKGISQNEEVFSLLFFSFFFFD